MKKVTIGIPAYKAQDHICDCLASIQIQTIKDDIITVIASDNPEDDYEFVKEKYPNLSSSVLHKALRNKDIKVNSKRINDPNFEINNGDILEIYIQL